MPQYTTFYIDDNLFGMDVLLIREINQNLDITPVDGAPEFVKGLLNLRGLIITVIDLGVILGLDKREINAETKVMVLKTNQEIEHLNFENLDIETTTNDMVGLLVDKIGDMVNVSLSDIDRPPANIGGIDGKFLAGIVKLENDLLVTLRMSEILNYSIA